MSREVEKFTGDLVRDSFRIATWPTDSSKRAATPRQPKSGKVRISQTHPEVWQKALEAANGDVQRIEVISEWEVVIHNNRKWRNGA